MTGPFEGIPFLVGGVILNPLNTSRRTDPMEITLHISFFFFFEQVNVTNLAKTATIVEETLQIF